MGTFSGKVVIVTGGALGIGRATSLEFAREGGSVAIADVNEAAGQAVWLDYLHRRILENGELQRLIDEDGLKGLTSNPSIFEKAIGDGDAYDDRLKALTRHGDAPEALYERLAIADIQRAADIFRPTWDRLGGRDGSIRVRLGRCFR